MDVSNRSSTSPYHAAERASTSIISIATATLIAIAGAARLPPYDTGAVPAKTGLRNVVLNGQDHGAVLLQRTWNGALSLTHVDSASHMILRNVSVAASIPTLQLFITTPTHAQPSLESVHVCDGKHGSLQVIDWHCARCNSRAKSMIRRSIMKSG